MEKQQQLEAFVRELASLGYTGKFTSFDQDTGKLEEVLQQFLVKNAASIESDGTAFTTLTTATEGTLDKGPFTAAHFLVDYEKEKGFIAGQLVVSRVDEKQQLVKNTTYELAQTKMIPGIAQVNKEALKPPQETKRQHRKQGMRG